jgi:hypothetical protein
MDVTRCPVCDQRFRVFGSENVMVHLLAIHADTTEARWVMAQLGVLVPAPSGDTDKKSEPVPNYDRGVAPTGATVDDALDAGLLASFTFRSRPPLILAEGSE